MNKYEIMFIVKPDMEEADIKKTADAMKKVLTGAKAKVLEEKANYYLLVVEASKEAEEEFTRVARINENLLRYLIVRVEDK